mgnify:CR=1 FL=1
MSIQSIDRTTSPTESLRRVPARIKSSLAERALRKRVARQTHHIEELHELPIFTEVTDQRRLSQAITAVREIAELTQDQEDVVVQTAEAALNDSAEHLFGDLKEAESTGSNKLSLGIRAVHDALRAWDIAKTDATYDLAAAALNNFHGQGQANLAKALRAAKKSGSPFNDELENILQNDKAA